jgi:HEAT repeat protein
MKNEVMKILSAAEPEYEQAKSYTNTAIPVLLDILKGSDHMLAAKAVYFAAYMNIPESLTVLNAAAKHGEPIVRKACAGAQQAATYLNGAALLKQLLQDKLPDVRLAALKVVRKLSIHALKADIGKLRLREKDKGVNAYLARYPML